MSRRVVVVGGGIAGLAAAHDLARQGHEVTVLEAGERPGGKIRTEAFAGHQVDVGADAVLARQPHAVELARELGLGQALRAPVADEVWLSIRGRLRRLPPGTFFGVPTALGALAGSRVLSPRGLARAVAEPFRPASDPLTEDASVAEVVARRFGDEVVERLVEPLLGGVYAGRADELSVRATIPVLAEVAAADGSLLRQLAQRRADATTDGPVFLTVEGGLGRLVERTAEGLADVRTRTEVTGLAPGPGGWSVTTERDGWEADAVVLAVPAPTAAELLAEVSPDASRALRTIRYASVAVVSLAYPPQATHRIPAGSGLLVPRSEGRLVKAVTLSSQKWPHLASASGPFLLRASVGRIDAPPPEVPDEDLADRVSGELAHLLGVAGAPSEWRVTRWPASLPQYDVGHLERVRAIQAAVTRQAPGVHLTGAAYDGVGIAHCVRRSREVAAAIGS